MAKLVPYLNFNGNTEEVFNFYKSVFGGEFITFQRFRGNPGCENMPETDLDKIMHIALQIAPGYIIMATDVPPSMPQASVGNNISLSLDAESEEEATTLFNGLAASGTVGMPLEKMFWGAYFGMLTDKFGIQWMVNYDYKENQK